jgi:hypothetical protein
LTSLYWRCTVSELIESHRFLEGFYGTGIEDLQPTKAD